MSNKIYIKTLSDEALSYIKKNTNKIYNYIVNNDDNKWLNELNISKLFITKKYEIEDFDLLDNPDGKDWNITFKNAVTLYESLKNLPRFLITSENFWLWLYLDKFYSKTKQMMKLNSVSTFTDHWLFGRGIRRGIFFGVLSRNYFRVELTVDESRADKYELTRWIIENPERFRNLSWRSYSSIKKLTRGIISGEKKAFEVIGKEDVKLYPEVAKFISKEGSVKLLDVIEERDIEELVYNWIIKKIGDNQ